MDHMQILKAALTPDVAPMSPSALDFNDGGSVVRFSKSISARKDGWARTTLMIDVGYAKANCPSDTRKQTKKVDKLYWLFALARKFEVSPAMFSVVQMSPR